MKMQLVTKKPQTNGVISFVFKPEQPVVWQAGQYLHYRLDHRNPDDRGVERWFTISAAPFEQNVQITTRFTDKTGSTFKNALSGLQIGDYIDADTPEGDFLLDTQAKKHIFVAGGIGITPYRSMLAELNNSDENLQIELLYANSDDKFVFDEEIQSFTAKNPNLHIKKFIGNDPTLISNLEQYSKDPGTTFYFSGPRKMVIDYRDYLVGLNIPKERLKTDFFPGY